MIGCATCGAAPVGTYNDGSPRFSVTCDHPPIMGDIEMIDPYGRVIETLDAAEMAEAYDCGKLRFDRAQRRKAQDHFNEPSLASHVRGAQGERAFAKWAGVPWECTVGQYGGKPDVAGCQIRAVSSPKLLCKIRENDPDRIPVVSIVENGTERFWIRGWILARDGRRLGKKSDPGNRNAEAWFVDTVDLLPMSEFLSSNAVRAAMGKPPVGL